MYEELPPRQQPEQPVDYLQEHPNAIVDPVKAEIMAYASKDQEQIVVDRRDLALDAAIGGNAEGAKHHIQFAQEARKRADDRAAQAAEIYDKVKGL